MKTGRLLTGALLAALVIALAAFAGVALADSGHGHGGQDGQSAQVESSNHSGGDGDQSRHPDQRKGSSTNGVKPSNTTQHDSYAPASSNKTKEYGNGKTAGQIATQKGYGDATLHGPGNSQPHKTVSCGHKHEVDVHALKSANSCGGSEQPSPSSDSQEQTANTQANDAKSGVSAEHRSHVKAKEDTQKTHGACEATVSASEAADETAADESGSADETGDCQAASEEQAATAEVENDLEKGKITICHATGSSTNPYVEITISVNGLHGHGKHADDIIPAPAAGCPSTTVSSTTATSTTETTAACAPTTETVVIGVLHHTGSKKKPYVLIQPNAHSAHFSKHAGDIVLSKQIVVPAAADCAPTTTTTSSGSVGTTTTNETTTTAAGTSGTTTAATTTTAAGGVQGETTSAGTTTATPSTTTAAQAGGVQAATASGKPKSVHSGVLGEVAHGTLPYTGLPIWLVALIALGLIGAGVGIRQHARAGN